MPLGGLRWSEWFLTSHGWRLVDGKVTIPHDGEIHRQVSHLIPFIPVLREKSNRSNIYMRKKVFTPPSASAGTDNIFLDTRKTIICKLNSTTGKICPITADIMWQSQETITDDDVIVALSPPALLRINPDNIFPDPMEISLNPDL